MTLRVGIIGPALDAAPLSDECRAAVRAQFDVVFAAVDEALAEIKTNEPCYAEGAHKARLVCGLLEEVDGLAVEVLPPNWDFDAILPFPEANCRKYLGQLNLPHSPKIVRKFDAACKRATTLIALPETRQAIHNQIRSADRERLAERLREKAFIQSRTFLLGQIDVLIAVWDGLDDGKPANVAQVVRHAVKAKIPVVWIKSGETSRHAFPQLIDKLQSDGGTAGSSTNCLDGGLRDAITEVVAIPRDADPDEESHEAEASSARKHLEAFFAETWPRKAQWKAYDKLKRLMQGRWPFRKIVFDYEKDYRKPWTTFIGTSPAAGPLDARIGTVLMQRYAWADALAVEFSHRYRSAYLLCHLIGAFAVLLALSSLFPPPSWVLHVLVTVRGLFPPPSSMLHFLVDYKEFLLSIEIAFAATIGIIVFVGRRSHWHDKWIEYRALAEMLRGVRFLAYLGEHGQFQRPDHFGQAPSAWFVWYLRATLREIGLPHAVLDSKYQHDLLGAVDGHVIDGQLEYHWDNRRTLRRMHKLFHRGANLSFAASWIFLLGFVVSVGMWNSVGSGSGQRSGGSGPNPPPQLSEQMKLTDKPVISDGNNAPHPGPAQDTKPKTEETLSQNVEPMTRSEAWKTFWVVLLTAVGAALAGIRESGEFESSAEHSAKAAVALQNLKGDIAQARHELTLDMTSEALLKTAQVLTEDLAAWQSVYGRKQLNLT